MKVGDPTIRTRRGTDSMTIVDSSREYPNCENSDSPKSDEITEPSSGLNMSTRPALFLRTEKVVKIFKNVHNPFRGLSEPSRVFPRLSGAFPGPFRGLFGVFSGRYRDLYRTITIPLPQQMALPCQTIFLKIYLHILP